MNRTTSTAQSYSSHGNFIMEYDVSDFEDTHLYETYVKSTFITAECDNGLCSEEDWLFGDHKECILNTEGPLCGSCRNGSQILLARAGCVRCHNARVKLPLAAYILLVVLLTVISCLLMLYNNTGLSPILDSWLFFVQTSWYLFPKGDTFIYSSMYTVLTYGLGHVCLKEQLEHMQINCLLLVQPATLLAVFIGIRIARSYSKPGLFIARLQTHMSLVHVMWFTLVCSYFMLIFLCINMLWYVKLSTGQYVMSLGGSIPIFGRFHLKFALIAIFIIVVVIIPPPIILLLPKARASPYLMSFIDEACSSYRLNRRWWASVTLLRRVAIAGVGSIWIGDSVERLMSLATLLLIFVIFQKLAKPYKQGYLLRLSHNDWELAFLQTAICIAALCMVIESRRPSPQPVLYGIALTLFTAPTCVLILACLYKQCVSPRGGFGRFRKLSLRLWWRNSSLNERRVRAETELTETFCNNMLEEAREPFIVHQLRVEQADI